MARPIDRAELLRLVEQEDAHIVDVLPRREYEESHLPGAHSIPLRNLTSEIVADLPRDKPVVVYCQTGCETCHHEPRAGSKGWDSPGSTTTWVASPTGRAPGS